MALCLGARQQHTNKTEFALPQTEFSTGQKKTTPA